MQTAVGSLVVVALLGIAGFFGFRYYQTHSTPLATAIIHVKKTANLSFPIYYPDQSKLPSEYRIDHKSFTSPGPNIVIYSIDYPGGNLAVSEQQKPSESDLKSFSSQRIPLHTTLRTHVGEASVGAIGNQTVVSLPTQSDTWIIVTGPYATDQQKLRTVLSAFRK